MGKLMFVLKSLSFFSAFILALVSSPPAAIAAQNLLDSYMQNPTISVAQEIQEFTTIGTYTISGTVTPADAFSSGVIQVDVYPSGSNTILQTFFSPTTFTIGLGQRFFAILRTHDGIVTFSNVSLMQLGSSLELLPSRMQNNTITVAQTIQQFTTPGTYTISGTVTPADAFSSGVIQVDVYPLSGSTILRSYPNNTTFTTTSLERFFVILRIFDGTVTFSGVSLTAVTPTSAPLPTNTPFPTPPPLSTGGYTDWTACSKTITFEGGSASVATVSCIFVALNNIVVAAFEFAAVIAIIFIIIGGIKFLTARGDREKIESAKKTITYAIVGLVLISLAYLIIALIEKVTEVEIIRNPFS